MTKRLGPEEWRKLVQQLEESQLTQKQFAEKEGVPVGSLQFWLYKVRREGQRASLPTLLPVEVVGSAAPSARRQGPTVEASPVSSSAPLEVLLPSGAMLRFACGTDVDYLKQLLSVLA